MTIHVVSTGLDAPTKARCLASVAAQTVPHVHTYVEAGDQDPPKGALENRWRAIDGLALEPTDVIVAIDGDDWLAHPRALETVAKMYEDPECWLTYGQYVVADGRPGHCSPYRTEDYRREEWRAGHLMTFRAGLFKRLDDGDLRRPDGTWRKLAGDQAMMLPMLEMCGNARAKFCPEVLCVYNFANAFEHTADAEGLREERDAALEIRSFRPRERLVSL